MPDTTTGTTRAPRPVRQRSFAGPIILIALGVVFLLGTMRVISCSRILLWFAHWWPLLLIFYGLLKLVEYYTARHDGTQFRGLGAGGVLLVIFIIIFGLSLSAANGVNWKALGDEAGWQGQFGDLFGQEYNFTQTLEQDYPAGANLNIISHHGDVTVTAWDQNKIKVEVKKTVRAESQEDANKADQATQSGITVAANELTLNANNDNRPVTSDLQIFVPKKGAVSVETEHGDVVVRDRDGNVRIADSHGDVKLENVNGSADVNMKHGDFNALNITGDVALDGRLNDVAAADIGGNLRMTGEYFGDLKISKVAKAVTFKTSRTDLLFTKLDGDMNMQPDDLRVNSLSGPIRRTTRAKDIHLENVSGDIDLKNSSGTVDIRATDKLGQMSIANRNGSVSLLLPAKANFQIDATSESGEINTDFGSLNTSRQHNNSTVTGQVGSGGPKIQINSQHGDVSIRKS
jgi:DUF4097 and DUF4098 domain-containing protein YvlB